MKKQFLFINFTFDYDSFDDLVIGAPFYAKKKNPNMGKVYIYGRNATSVSWQDRNYAFSYKDT